MKHKPAAHLRRIVGKTINDYHLINEGDRILVAVSGGKDSWSLLHILIYFQKVSPFSFDIFPVTIDLGFPDVNIEAVEYGYKKISETLTYKIVKTDIAGTIQKSNEKGKNPCAFCARLRRGALYRVAKEMKFNKIALGHHADDAIETLFISGFYEGSLVSMPPRLLVSQNQITLIRPLIKIFETDLTAYCSTLGITPITCTRHQNLKLQRRHEIKEWLSNIEKSNPFIKKNLLKSLHNIKPLHFHNPKWL